MIRKLLASLLVVAALGSTNSLPAQITLDNFSSFLSPKTLFFGDWAQSGDPFAGDLAPVGTFGQGAGFYRLGDASNSDTAFVDRTFATPQNLGVSDSLALSLRLLAGNTAETFTIFLFDSSGDSAFSTFQLSRFTSSGFTTQNLLLTSSSGFDSNAVTSYRLSGNDPFSGATLNVELDNLAAISSAVTNPPPSPVPESATYAAWGMLGLLAIIAQRGALRRSKSQE